MNNDKGCSANMKKDKYLSKEYTNCLRGIFAILVMIHHLDQYSGLFKGSQVEYIFSLSGSLSVAIFFFYSGYGLMFSAGKKDYIKNFFRNRFLPLYCFYCILIVLYSILTLLLEKNISAKLVVQSFFYGGTVVNNGWYLQATFIIYILYLAVFKIFKSPKMQILSLGMSIFAYCGFCFIFDMGTWWYQTILCVILGMIYFYKKEKIDALLLRYSWIFFLLSSALFVLFVILSNISPIFHVVYSLFFACTIIFLSYILCDTPVINNSFFALCGKYSLEIYVTHGFFLKLIKLDSISNILIYVVTVIVATMVASIMLKKIYTQIVSFFSTSRL